MYNGKTKRLLAVLGRLFLVAVGSFLGVCSASVFLSSKKVDIRMLSAEQRIPYPSDIKLTFDVGDYVSTSDLQLTSIDGNLLRLDEIKDKLIIVFLSPTCDECPPFMNKWQDEIAPYIRSDVQVYYAISEDEYVLSDLDLQDVTGVVVRFSQSQLARSINLIAFPTILCLTEELQVFDIQYGGTEFYHTEMVEAYTTR